MGGACGLTRRHTKYVILYVSVTQAHMEFSESRRRLFRYLAGVRGVKAKWKLCQLLPPRGHQVVQVPWILVRPQQLAVACILLGEVPLFGNQVVQVRWILVLPPQLAAACILLGEVPLSLPEIGLNKKN